MCVTASEVSPRHSSGSWNVHQTVEAGTSEWTRWQTTHWRCTTHLVHSLLLS